MAYRQCLSMHTGSRCILNDGHKGSHESVDHTWVIGIGPKGELPISADPIEQKAYEDYLAGHRATGGSALKKGSEDGGR